MIKRLARYILRKKSKPAPKVKFTIRDGKMIGYTIPGELNNPATRQRVECYKYKLNGFPHLQGLGDPFKSLGGRFI